MKSPYKALNINRLEFHKYWSKYTQVDIYTKRGRERERERYRERRKRERERKKKEIDIDRKIEINYTFSATKKEQIFCFLNNFVF